SESFRLRPGSINRIITSYIYIYIYLFRFFVLLSLSLSSGERGRTVPCAYGLRRSFPFPFLGCFHRIAEADRLMLNPLRVGSSLLSALLPF
ncbi:hypothetical protein B296_00059230, partial [Ensete ventricosum]